MSTKNLFHNGFNGTEQSTALPVFLIISALVHLLAYLLITNSTALHALIGLNENSKVNSPVVVEMVVLPEPEAAPKAEPKKALKPEPKLLSSTERKEFIILPETVKSDAPEKKEVYRYADRDVSVTKEHPETPGEKREGADKESAAKQNGATEAGKSKTAPVQATTHRAVTSVATEGIARVPKGAKVVPQHMRVRKGSVTKSPNLFPSTERLAAIAKSTPSKEITGKTGTIRQLNSTKTVYAKYNKYVIERINYYWKYPAVAIRNGWHGTVHIRFFISRDGKIAQISIAKSSGYPALDDATLTAVKLAGPFNAFPEHFETDMFDWIFQFYYPPIVYAPPVN